MADGTVDALVFDDDSYSSSEAVHFAGFPGRWFKGQPIAVSELGFVSLEEAEAAATAHGLSLTSTTVPAGEGLMPDLSDPAMAPGRELGDGEVFPPDPVRPDEEESRAEQIEHHAHELLAKNFDEVVAAVATLDDPQELAQMLADEQAGKNRTSVVKAIADRQSELHTEGEDA